MQIFYAMFAYSVHFSVCRLLDQLPRANVLLLRYLFGLLHNIEQHSSSNQMTAFNLAVCIAPSILWPPTSSSPELENEFTKKVTKFFLFLLCGTSSPKLRGINSERYMFSEVKILKKISTICTKYISL